MAEMNQTPIQILLIFFLILMVWVYFHRLRSRLLDRAVFFLIAAVGLVMIIRPDWASYLANVLGVGRGADLVTYLGVSGLAFLWLRLYTRQRDLEEHLTELARNLSILRAKQPSKKKRNRK